MVSNKSDKDEKRTELIQRASKAFINVNSTGFLQKKQDNKTPDYLLSPDYNLNRVMELIRNDATVVAAISTLTDKVLEPGWYLYGKDKRSRLTDAEEQMRKLRLDTVMRETLFQLLIYNNAFIEVVRVGDEKAKELHVLETNTIEINVDEHGEVLQYVQTSPNATNSNRAPVTWTPEEVVHIKMESLINTSNEWGDITLKTLWTASALKYHIKKFLLWQFETNQFRPLLNIQDATDEQITRFLGFLKESEKDIKKLLPIEGQVEIQHLMQEMDYDKLVNIMNKLDSEILTQLQVPPIAVGLPDNSNRSNSDSQNNSLNTRVHALQQKLIGEFGYELFPKMGYDKIFLRFNIVDMITTKQVIEVAKGMKDMMLKESIIKEFFEKNGWDMPEGDIFEETVDLSSENGQIPRAGEPPSREPKGAGMANDKIGTGQSGTTREDQLVKRAYYEPCDQMAELEKGYY